MSNTMQEQTTKQKKRKLGHRITRTKILDISPKVILDAECGRLTKDEHNPQIEQSQDSE